MNTRSSSKVLRRWSVLHKKSLKGPQTKRKLYSRSYNLLLTKSPYITWYFSCRFISLLMVYHAVFFFSTIYHFEVCYSYSFILLCISVPFNSHLILRRHSVRRIPHTVSCEFQCTKHFFSVKNWITLRCSSLGTAAGVTAISPQMILWKHSVRHTPRTFSCEFHYPKHFFSIKNRIVFLCSSLSIPLLVSLPSLFFWTDCY